LFQFLLQNKEALRQFVYENESMKLSHDVGMHIASTIFWAELEGMVELLKPIDTLLKMFESNAAHLGMVLDRWKTILSHLT